VEQDHSLSLSPLLSSTDTGCNSQSCKDRLREVLGEVRKANQLVESLVTTMQTEQQAAERSLLHLKAVKKFQDDQGLQHLSHTDIKTLYKRFADDDDLTGPSNRSHSGPSHSGPSTSKSLTPQSMSLTGFNSADSDMDYVPGGDN